MNAKLAECLKKLRLSGMAQTLEVRLQEAAANRLDHAEFGTGAGRQVAVRKSGRSPAA